MDGNVSLEKSENVSINNELNNSRIQSFLLNEFEKKNELKLSRDKIENIKKLQSSNLEDYDRIYRFKLEKTRGDALFSHINKSSRLDGTLLGTNINNYLNHVQRFNLSKDLISQAQLLERSWIRNFSDFLSHKIWRYRYNYLFKGVVVFGFYTSVKNLVEVARNCRNAEQLRENMRITLLGQRLSVFTLLSFSLFFV